MGFNEETQGVREYALIVHISVDSESPVEKILAEMEKEARNFPEGMRLVTETYALTVTGAWEAGKRKPARSSNERTDR